MKFFTARKELNQYLQLQKKSGCSIGFTPTMGALHDGHLALIKKSKQENNISVCSIFVNPAQFNDKADFEKYPQTLETDINLLEKINCDILFAPTVNEIYQQPDNPDEIYALGFLDKTLEGLYRPGHFQGVCKVMYRLLTIVDADNLYMGQKDYQQCMVVKKLIELADFKVQLHICKTIREENGLAMSSRNMRLSVKQKEAALAIYQSLIYIKKEISKSMPSLIIENVKKKLVESGFEKIDYVSVANATNLELINEWDGKTPLVALVAAFIGNVRLIDNMILAED